MNKVEFTVIQSVQTLNRGAVVLGIVDKDKKQVPGSLSVTISFPDPAEAAKFKAGQSMTVTIE